LPRPGTLQKSVGRGMSKKWYYLWHNPFAL